MARIYKLKPADAALSAGFCVSESAGRPVSGLVNCGIRGRNPDNQGAQTIPKADPLAINSFLKFIYDEAPVVGFRVMKNDVVTVRAARYPDDLADRLVGSVRGKIEYLSMRSRRRLALTAGNSPVVFRSFVTVSYPREFPCDGVIVKGHLDLLLRSLRRKCKGLEYLWFLEFQARGAPHLHAFLNFELPGPLAEMKRKRKSCRVNWALQDWISARWFEIVGSGDERHLRAGAAWEAVEKPDGAARYVAKESYKTFQKVVPLGFQNVGRFWGCSKNVRPDEGFMVWASKEETAAALGPKSCDPEGNPFPVVFSAAHEYEKIRDTTADPAKFRAWKNGRSQKDLHPMMSDAGLSSGKKPPLHARDQWHGSILNDSTR